MRHHLMILCFLIQMILQLKVKLGTSNKNTYTTTIGALNTALLQAGYSPYSIKKKSILE